MYKPIPLKTQDVELNDNDLNFIKGIIEKKRIDNKTWTNIIDEILHDVGDKYESDENRKLRISHEILKGFGDKLELEDDIKYIFDNLLPETIFIMSKINDYTEVKLPECLKEDLLEVLGDNDITEYNVWMNLVRISIQIVETYPDLMGYEKKRMIMETLKEIINDLESDKKEKMSFIYDKTLEPSIEAIVSAWNAKVPKKSLWCCFI